MKVFCMHWAQIKTDFNLEEQVAVEAARSDVAAKLGRIMSQHSQCFEKKLGRAGHLFA